MKNIEISKIMAKFFASFVIIMLIFSVFKYNKMSYAADVTYTQTIKKGIENFPETYKKLLEEFVEETGTDNWTFYAYYTGIDWNQYIKDESGCGNNRVYQAFDTAYRCDCGDISSAYACANSDIISYFVDPRNFINQRNIFQFLEISYNEEIHTKKIIETMVSKYKVFNYGNNITFKMTDENHKNYGQNVTMSYVDIVEEAAKKSQMSPISIIIKIVQEVGADGSGSTSGTNSKYPSTYNFFNIGSYDEGDAILNGLKYADNMGWHDPYTSIVEGAQYNSKYYIQAGQNTAYFYKFDCVGSTILQVGADGKPGTQTINSSQLYHRYMTNVYDPYSQSATLFSTYTNNDLLDEDLSFIIPVFDNMPETPAEKPSTLLSSGNQNLYYADITSSLYTRTGPGTNYSTMKVDYKNSKGEDVSETLMLYKDDLVIMLDRKAVKNGSSYWDKVQFWNGKIGYVLTEYLEPYEAKTTPEPEPELPETIIGYGYADVKTTLNLRAGAGSSYKVIDSLVSKEEFYILKELDSWYKVKTLDGETGYVSKSYAEKIAYAAKKDNTINIIPNASASMVATYLGVEEYTVKKGDKVIENDVLGTGYTFTVGGTTYNIVKVGDVNGDGKTNTGDAYLVQKHVVGLTTLSDLYLQASEINYDNKNNTGDAYLIQKYVVGLQPIQLSQ